MTWNQLVTMYGKKQYRTAMTPSATGEKKAGDSRRRRSPIAARRMHGTRLESVSFE